MKLMDQVKHINYALVEDTRPPLYTAMKYWGKKPHNIWSQFIESYTKQNEFVFDPFTGSGISAFEAVKLKRKAIAFDLNPLTSFFIESLCSDFDEAKFLVEKKAAVFMIGHDSEAIWMHTTSGFAYSTMLRHWAECTKLRLAKMCSQYRTLKIHRILLCFC